MYTESQIRLGTNASTVKYLEFESALVKIQMSTSLGMTETELSAVSILKIHGESLNSSDNVRFLPLAERALEKCRLTSVVRSSYVDTRFILPNHNVCKASFLTAAFVLSDRR